MSPRYPCFEATLFGMIGTSDLYDCTSNASTERSNKISYRRIKISFRKFLKQKLTFLPEDLFNLTTKTIERPRMCVLQYCAAFEIKMGKI